MHPSFTIRQTTIGDHAVVSTLLTTSYPVLLAPDYRADVLARALPLITRAQPSLLTSGTYYLAETPDGQIVGAGGWTRAAPKGPDGAPLEDVPHIRHVVSDHRCVHQGIGRAIMAQIFRTARAAHVDRMACLSTLTAVPFYQRMGFEVAGHQDVRLPQDVVFPAVRMERAL